MGYSARAEVVLRLIDRADQRAFSKVEITELQFLQTGIYVENAMFDEAYETLMKAMDKCEFQSQILHTFQHVYRSLNYDTKCARALKRLVRKSPERSELRILAAHMYFATASYSKAAEQYLHLLHGWFAKHRIPRQVTKALLQLATKQCSMDLPDGEFCSPVLVEIVKSLGENSGSSSSDLLRIIHDPEAIKYVSFLYLMLGLTYMQHAMKRNTFHRTHHILQGFNFLFHSYYISGKSAEASYNLGRAFHYIGINNYAYLYYEKALASDEKGAECIKHEAAYNLASICKRSGSVDYAVDQVLLKHIIV